MANKVIGIIGAAIGILVSLLYIIGGVLAAATVLFAGLGALAAVFGFITLLLNVLGLVGSLLVHSKPTGAGVMMIVSGALTFLISFVVGWPFFFTGLMLCIPGILVLVKKPKSDHNNFAA